MIEHHLYEYEHLRQEIDKKCNRLWKVHEACLNCKMGCSSCCQSFRVLPVEWYFIRENLKNRKTEVNSKAESSQCKFLINGVCSIYEFRPIICRTHGYPLARLNEEAGAYEISFCELNFKGFDLENFNRNNVLFEDRYNSKLFALNKRFIKDFYETQFDTIELVELNDIEVITI